MKSNIYILIRCGIFDHLLNGEMVCNAKKCDSLCNSGNIGDGYRAYPCYDRPDKLEF